MEFDKLKIIANTENHLLSSLKELSSINIIEFQSLQLKSSQFRNSKEATISLNTIKKSSNTIIYIIELVDLNKKNDLLNNFSEFIASNITKTKNINRINVSKNNKTGSQTLYVGSSITDFKSRIKNHLGLRGSRT